LSLIWLGRIGALCSVHPVGTLLGEMTRLAAGVASIGGDADSVVLAVVVGVVVASSRMLSVGVTVGVVGVWCRGWVPLLLGRRPWWWQTAGSLSAGATLM
jgi:hypothetical protein